jgi:hypothetical protein
MNKCDECFIYDFRIMNLETGFSIAAASADLRINMNLLCEVLQRINELCIERDEHRKAHDRDRAA